MVLNKILHSFKIPPLPKKERNWITKPSLVDFYFHCLIASKQKSQKFELNSNARGLNFSKIIESGVVFSIIFYCFPLINILLPSVCFFPSFFVLLFFHLVDVFLGLFYIFELWVGFRTMVFRYIVNLMIIITYIE